MYVPELNKNVATTIYDPGFVVEKGPKDFVVPLVRLNAVTLPESTPPNCNVVGAVV